MVRCEGAEATEKQRLKRSVRGDNGGDIFSGGEVKGPCPIIDLATGAEVSKVIPGQLFGASSKLLLASGTYVYQLCDHTSWAVKAIHAGVVTELCPTCIETRLEGEHHDTLKLLRLMRQANKVPFSAQPFHES